MRRAAFVAALAASWLVLLLWAAGVDWRAPVFPDSERMFPGSRFRAAVGRAVVDGSVLRVESPDAENAALQVTALPAMEADRFPVVIYRFEDFPRTLELSLVFRTAERPDDVQTISLPWPGRGTMAYDMSAIEAWRGTIIELGFAQFPTAHLVPAAEGFAPFRLRRAELWSPSWRGAVAALVTDWFGAWPWSQRSVHALGREGAASGVRSPVLFVAIAATLACGWAMLLLGLRGRRGVMVLCVCGLVGWILLDLRWQSGLLQRLRETRVLYSGLDWSARQKRVADDALLAAAAQVKALLRDEPPHRRVLVYSDSGYANLRMIWHLQPLNVGAFGLAAAEREPIPEDTILVFLQTDVWRANPAVRRHVSESERMFPGDVIHSDGFERPDLLMFRVRHVY